MLSNLRTEGMAAEDGPWLGGRSVPLGSVRHPGRQCTRSLGRLWSTAESVKWRSRRNCQWGRPAC